MKNWDIVVKKSRIIKGTGYGKNVKNHNQIPNHHRHCHHPLQERPGHSCEVIFQLYGLAMAQGQTGSSAISNFRLTIDISIRGN